MSNFGVGLLLGKFVSHVDTDLGYDEIFVVVESVWQVPGGRRVG